MKRPPLAHGLIFHDLNDLDDLDDLDDLSDIGDLDDDTYGAYVSDYDVDDGERFDLRDDILGIETMTDDQERSRFSGLRLAGVAVLFEERLLDPDARQGLAPSALECVAFLCRWPEVSLHGYALHPARADEGGTVRVEGLACDALPDSAARREGLREAFDAFTRRADLRLDTPDALYAIWH